jgi:hypothetical protein
MQENSWLKLPRMSKNTVIEKINNSIYINIYPQMSVSKSKFWYNNNCLHFSKRAAPLNLAECLSYRLYVSTNVVMFYESMHKVTSIIKRKIIHIWTCFRAIGFFNEVDTF